MDWQLPSKASELLWTLVKCKITSEIIAYPGERDLTDIFRPDTEINENKRL